MKFEKWEIYRANLDPVVGSEQGKSRPVVIISVNIVNELLNLVNVLPISSKKAERKIYPNEVIINSGEYGMINDSVILCHQIRTLDKTRLSKMYGKIDDLNKKEEIIEAICFQLGIDK
jgi:mRNA interferase MazF